MSPGLVVQGLAVTRAGRPLLGGVDLQVEAGRMVGVLGVNGAGKTTLLRAALGLQARTAGTVELGGRPLESMAEPQRAALVGYLPQERRVAWNLSALAVASLGAVTASPERAEALARQALERVGLADLADRGVLDMSGGERARVLLARLLATAAPLLVADEPIAGLDPDAQMMTLELLRDETRQGRSVLVTLHDLSLAARFCDDVLLLRHGRPAGWGAPAEVLTRERLQAVFGLDGALIDSPHGPILAAGRG